MKVTRTPALLCAVVALTLTGCDTEFHGHDSGIDGVLWRQIASLEDPLSESLWQTQEHDPQSYLNALPSDQWDGQLATVDALDLATGKVIIYDETSTATTARFSIFIASGVRPDVPTDAKERYAGPSVVFTCYGVTADFGAGTLPTVDRVIFSDCPAALEAALPSGSAFASAEVFDG